MNTLQKMVLIAKNPSLLYTSRKRPWPTKSQIFTTWSCNAKCPMCSYGSVLGKREFVSVADVSKFFSQCSGKMLYTHMLGGEPLIHPEIDVLTKVSVDAGCVTSIVTNGIRLAHWAERIVKAGLHRITISVDGFDEQSCLARNGVPNTFKMIQEGIAALKKAKGHKLFPAIYTNTVPAKSQLRYLPSILDFVSSLKPDKIMVNNMQWYNQIHEDERETSKNAGHVEGDFMIGAKCEEEDYLTDEEWEHFMSVCRMYPKIIFNDLIYRKEWFKHGKLPMSGCQIIDDTINIMPGGKLGICIGAVQIGDLSGGVLAAWNGPIRQDIKQQLKSNNGMKTCHRCNFQCK